MEKSCQKLFWNKVSISTENQTVRRSYKKLRKENAEKDSDIYFGNENSLRNKMWQQRKEIRRNKQKGKMKI